jgi:hypothetical protein
MKIFPPARFKSYGIDEPAVEILVNRVFSRIQSLYMFANSEVFAINCDWNSWMNCFSDHSKAMGGIQV